MAFHVEGSEAFALSREEVFYQFKGVNGAEFRKEGGEGVLGGRFGESAYRKCDQSACPIIV
jgi:hypothetical protein